MKFTKLLFSVLLLFVTNIYGQNKVNEIRTKEGVRFITTSINYPITGTYLFEGKTEPIVQLNLDGTGIFQLHELPTTAMIWGIECNEIGDPKFIEGFDSATYTLWYKNTAESSDEESWISVQFSIHFVKKKMYILGERIKDYID